MRGSGEAIAAIRAEHRLPGAPKASASSSLPTSAAIGMIEHDIRTAATVISGYTRILLDERVGSLGPDQRKFLSETARAAGRISCLLDNLLEFASLGRAGKLEVRAEPLQLHDLLNAAVATLRPFWSERDQRVELDLGAAQDWVLGDPGQLERVFVNLIQNAIRFGPRGQKLRISSQLLEAASPGVIRVTVEDEGPGVSDAELDSIFEPFSRGTAATPGSGQGVGLGLSICRSVVEAHGGEITVESVSGSGGCFNVHLPLSEHRRENGQTG